MKRQPVLPPELRDWQVDALARIARSRLGAELVFGGGAALAAVHLHHRISEDLDFFSPRELRTTDLAPLARSLRRAGIAVEQSTLGAVRTLVLSRGGEDFGKIDVVYSPFDPVDRRTRWRGLLVESLLDMAVGKVQAVLTRFQPRDLVDLYFLMREGPEPDSHRLLDHVRAKFGIGADPFALAERLLLARDITTLPRMLREVTTAALVEFFEDTARTLVRPR